jgi:hypothetical protein
MSLNLNIPPLVETQVTGFAMSAEKSTRKALWRFEYWLGDSYPRVLCNGEPVTSLDDCPKGVIKALNNATKIYNGMVR